MTKGRVGSSAVNPAQGWRMINHGGWGTGGWEVALQLSSEKAVIINWKREKEKALEVRREPMAQSGRNRETGPQLGAWLRMGGSHAAC